MGRRKKTIRRVEYSDYQFLHEISKSRNTNGREYTKIEIVCLMRYGLHIERILSTTGEQSRPRGLGEPVVDGVRS